MPIAWPDGTSGLQPSRVIGINGTRWLLRATLLGRPAVEPETGEPFEEALTTVAVRRGDHAMPVGDPLPLTLPPDAPVREAGLVDPEATNCVARTPRPHKTGTYIDRWANSTDQHARELRQTVRESGLVAIDRGP